MKLIQTAEMAYKFNFKFVFAKTIDDIRLIWWIRVRDEGLRWDFEIDILSIDFYENESANNTILLISKWYAAHYTSQWSPWVQINPHRGKAKSIIMESPLPPNTPGIFSYTRRYVRVLSLFKRAFHLAANFHSLFAFAFFSRFRWKKSWKKCRTKKPEFQ